MNTDFREGFTLGTQMPIGMIDLIIHMREGATGKPSDLATLLGKTERTVSEQLWKLRGSGVRIIAWEGRHAVFGYGWEPDVTKDKANPLRNEGLARGRKTKLAKAVEFMRNVTQQSRLTMHGTETVRGNVRTHRME